MRLNSAGCFAGRLNHVAWLAAGLVSRRMGKLSCLSLRHNSANSMAFSFWMPASTVLFS